MRQSWDSLTLLIAVTVTVTVADLQTCLFLSVQWNIRHLPTGWPQDYAPTNIDHDGKRKLTNIAELKQCSKRWIHIWLCCTLRSWFPECSRTVTLRLEDNYASNAVPKNFHTQNIYHHAWKIVDTTLQFIAEHAWDFVLFHLKCLQVVIEKCWFSNPFSFTSV